MSGKYDDKQGHSFVLTDFLHPEDEQLLNEIFDHYGQLEDFEILKEMQETRFFKKVCLIKTLLYPYEFLLTFALLEKQFVIERKDAQSIYWRFLRGKLTLNEFKRELMKVTKVDV